jgi:hypothetical protein
MIPIELISFTKFIRLFWVSAWKSVQPDNPTRLGANAFIIFAVLNIN